MKKTDLIGLVLAAGVGISTLTGCNLPFYKDNSGTSVSSDTMSQSAIATFDDIYSSKYTGFSIAYQGIPKSYVIDIDENNTLAIYFEDEESSRIIYASCETGMNQLEFTMANMLLEKARKDNLPITVFGTGNNGSIDIESLSFMTGPGRWENILLVDYVTHNFVPTPGGQ